MDETSVAKGHDCITLFADLDERKTIHISKGKGSDTIKSFVDTLECKDGDRKNIRDVSCDMSRAFIKGVKKYLPEAAITGIIGPVFYAGKKAKRAKKIHSTSYLT